MCRGRGGYKREQQHGEGKTLGNESTKGENLGTCQTKKNICAMAQAQKPGSTCIKRESGKSSVCRRDDEVWKGRRNRWRTTRISHVRETQTLGKLKGITGIKRADDVWVPKKWGQRRQERRGQIIHPVQSAWWIVLDSKASGTDYSANIVE